LPADWKKSGLLPALACVRSRCRREEHQRVLVEFQLGEQVEQAADVPVHRADWPANPSRRRPASRRRVRWGLEPCSRRRVRVMRHGQGAVQEERLRAVVRDERQRVVEQEVRAYYDLLRRDSAASGNSGSLERFQSAAPRF
jgi:hypothetical protein